MTPGSIDEDITPNAWSTISHKCSSGQEAAVAALGTSSEPVRSRFSVEPVKVINFECNDAAIDRNNLLYNNYFSENNDDVDEHEAFSPYDLLVRLHFPLGKTHRRASQIEKFRNYWENYSFYAIWRRKFIADHSCDEQDLWKEFFFEAIPHILINLFLSFYVLGGAVIFQLIDDSIRQEKFHNVVQFTFTTVATVGYGNIVPKTDMSKVFCMFYTLVGVPLLFLSLTNIGQFIAEGYWIFLASLSREHEIDARDERRLPLRVVITLLLTHSAIGGLLFHFWIDEMPVIPAVYFSFVSITTIGYGDITPTPNNSFQAAIIILYLSVGMVIMSTFVAALYNYLRRLHYLGRTFTGAAHVEVWFGGTRMSVSELLHIVAEQFNVSPKILYGVLHDLDEIITAATDPKSVNIEVDEPKRGLSTRSGKQRLSKKRKRQRVKRIEMVDSEHPEQKHILLKVDSHSNLNMLPEDQRDNAVQALGMLHHLTKTKSNIRDTRRSSSASTKLLLNTRTAEDFARK